MSTETPNRNTSRIRFSKREGVNPFTGIPIPIAMESFGLRAADAFEPRRLARHLEKNSDWLQFRPRSSNEIESALIPEYSLGGMQESEVRQLLNHALWEAGYTPDEDCRNPLWTWTDGK